jgi:hypothetical protein
LNDASRRFEPCTDKGIIAAVELRRGTWLVMVPILLVVACTTSTTTVTPSPTTTVFADYDGGELSFEYPADWRILDENDICFHDYTYVAIGTGDWISGCVDNSPGGEVSLVDPGEIVARVSYFYSGPVSTTFQVPPFDARQLESGLVSTAGASQVTVFVPGHRPLSVEARFGGQPNDAQLAALDRLIQTIDLDEQIPADLRTSDDDPRQTRCSETTTKGRLTRGDGGEPNLATAGSSWVTVIWPEGWRAQAAEDHRLVLLDAIGEPRAREWDELEVGGYSDENEELHACPDAVRVTRQFPRN